ncbi:Metabotropic glutamate receptor-like protein E [Hondaea fermentalgiana]|uniref:Metabotropic glutamate receptor-like protein E n=1 Tax=Hondaea fermentalgiana TaxID=2315210 RepID=A0A2R5GGL0_9STRA|nr:Metabotropic glutamate receptor-like protein E [Hondaea fermentalgiana]|eukprot:GBG30032.1 Metabotropic glutamate receptor-like protein E [Hondaea fermentalgiana]
MVMTMKHGLCIALLAMALGVTHAQEDEYGVCENNSCNDYVKDRVCNVSTVTEDAYIPTPGTFKIGVMRDLRDTNGADFAAMCAFQHAKDDGILTGIDLDMIWLDEGSAQDVPGGVEAGLCMAESGLNLAIGPSSSSVSQGVAMVSNVYEQNNIATTATSPSLSNADTYKFFSRVIAADTYQGSMLARYAVTINDWRKIATLSIASNTYFQGITTVFEDEATALGAEITTYTIPSDFTSLQIEEALRKIRDSGVRVIMAAMRPMHDTLVVANQTGMLDEGWAWLTTETTISILFSNMLGLPASKLENMDILLDGVIGLVPKMDVEGEAYQKWMACIDEHYNDTTTGGMFDDMGAQSTARAGSYEEGVAAAKIMWNGYYYDAMQVALRALDSVTEAERSDAVVVREAIRSTVYNGTTGTVEMNADGDRIGVEYEILNIFNRTTNVIGTIDVSTESIILSQDAHFPGDTLTVPADFVMSCDLQVDYHQTVSECRGSTRTVTYEQDSEESIRYCPDIAPFEVDCDHALFTGPGMPLVCVGLAIVLIATLVLLLRWNHKIIRLSQRQFLLIMMIGAFVSLVGPLVAIGELNDLRCAALPCFTTLGYVLLFGPLFVKTWRVNVLVHNTRMRILKISNQMLYRRLFLLVLLTAIMLAVMLIIDPPRRQASAQPVQANGVTHLIDFETCVVESRLMGNLLISLLGLMTLYGCFVSFQIRNVSSELSESRWIFLSVYNGALLSTVTLAVVLGLDLSYAQLHLFATLGIVLTCVVTVLLIMVPKLVNIYKNVAIFSSGSSAGTKGITVPSAPRGIQYVDKKEPSQLADTAEGSAAETIDESIRPPPSRTSFSV